MANRSEAVLRSIKIYLYRRCRIQCTHGLVHAVMLTEWSRMFPVHGHNKLVLQEEAGNVPRRSLCWGRSDPCCHNRSVSGIMLPNQCCSYDRSLHVHASSTAKIHQGSKNSTIRGQMFNMNMSPATRMLARRFALHLNHKTSWSDTSSMILNSLSACC